MRNDKRCVHVTIHGRVQGVGYRAWTERNAVKRGLAGWVKNRNHGTVEALFCGPAAAVAEMLEACNEGPLAAQVTGVEVHEATMETSGSFKTLATD